MEPDEREYFLSRKNLRERTVENYRVYEEEIAHERTEIRGYADTGSH